LYARKHGYHDQLRQISLGINALLLVWAVAVIFAGLDVAYSDGQRAGYVQTLSRGAVWMCKNWGGEMALVSAPRTMTDRFPFTVSSESVASKIKASLGQRVALHYRQYKLVRGLCFGDSQYLVTDVRAIG
jgi:hypothetical protein